VRKDAEPDFDFVLEGRARRWQGVHWRDPTRSVAAPVRCSVRSGVPKRETKTPQPSPDLDAGSFASPKEARTPAAECCSIPSHFTSKASRKSHDQRRAHATFLAISHWKTSKDCSTFVGMLVARRALRSGHAMRVWLVILPLPKFGTCLEEEREAVRAAGQSRCAESPPSSAGEREGKL
jgi:hypothetical protein